MSEDLMGTYDVIVIGGGAAGLNGALLLARSRRTVAVIDAGMPRNAPAAGVHGLLGHDGVPPSELLERGRAEVLRYGGHVVTDNVTNVTPDDDQFVVSLADHRSMTARRILVTAGLVDELPDIPGLRERWGRDVLHCPYCHGWEVRDQRIGVLANGPRSVHQALLFRQLSDEITYFTNATPLTDEEAKHFEARGIAVIDTRISRARTDPRPTHRRASRRQHGDRRRRVRADALHGRPRRLPRRPRTATGPASIRNRRPHPRRRVGAHERAWSLGGRQRHRHRRPSRRVCGGRSVRRTADQRGPRRRRNARGGCALAISTVPAK